MNNCNEMKKFNFLVDGTQNSRLAAILDSLYQYLIKNCHFIL